MQFLVVALREEFAIIERSSVAHLGRLRGGVAALAKRIKSQT